MLFLSILKNFRIHVKVTDVILVVSSEDMRQFIFVHNIRIRNIPFVCSFKVSFLPTSSFVLKWISLLKKIFQIKDFLRIQLKLRIGTSQEHDELLPAIVKLSVRK